MNGFNPNYGQFVKNFRAWTDDSFSFEIPLEEIPEETFRKIIGRVPLVRCKDCANADYELEWNRGDAYCATIDKFVEDDFFCAHGERKRKNGN